MAGMFNFFGDIVICFIFKLVEQSQGFNPCINRTHDFKQRETPKGIECHGRDLLNPSLDKIPLGI